MVPLQMVSGGTLFATHNDTKNKIEITRPVEFIKKGDLVTHN